VTFNEGNVYKGFFPFKSLENFMRIGVLGINFKSAGIDVRELVSKACQKRLSYASRIAEKYACVVLSTCNRTEIYFTWHNLADAHSELLHLLREEVPVAFEHQLYSYFGLDCFLHLAQVTAGLDSAIVAESEIQRQVKLAYEQTLLYHSLPSCMHYLFQKSLKMGKEVRSHLPLSHNQITIAKILFEVSSQVLKGFLDMPVLFIGNSEINRSVMTLFKRRGVERISLCTRSLHSAAEMAERERLSLLSWDQLSSWKDYSLVICGSNAPHYIVSPSLAMAQCMTRLVFDLSVPRNVDPSLARHPQLTLLNIERLGSLIADRQREHAIEIKQAEGMIQEGVWRSLRAFQQKEERVFACA
jgi:glutamyl-tRNA reductase